MSEALRIATLSLPDSLLRRIDDLAERERVRDQGLQRNRSATVRRLISKALELADGEKAP